MSTNTIQLTGQLARAARALVGISSTHTAAEAGISRKRLRNFEKGQGSLGSEQLAALRLALESHGAVFIADGEDGSGHGVRLKFSAAKVEKIESWESEGGLAADDDV